MAAPSFSDVDDWHPTWLELMRKYPEVEEAKRDRSLNYPIDLNESEDEDEPCYPCYVTPSVHAMTTRDETRELGRLLETELFIDVFGINARDANCARHATLLTGRRERKRADNWANGKKTRFRGKGSKSQQQERRAKGGRSRHDSATQCRLLDYHRKYDEPWTYKRHLQWETSDEA